MHAIAEIYQLLSEGMEKGRLRGQARLHRMKEINRILFRPVIKQAFDTRRIDQETEYNPRRGLQSYHRSEAFIAEAMEQKIKNFTKLRKVLCDIKQEYGREPEWQDSNARVLLSTLDNGLRVDIQDGDFSEAQPAMGSLDYIEELMHVRYRLGFDALTKIGELELKKAILSKDEEMVKKGTTQPLQITKRDIATHNYDGLLDKLFEGCRASAEHPDIERTITITIRDRFPGISKES
jgi:hypothetical protein